MSLCIRGRRIAAFCAISSWVWEPGGNLVTDAHLAALALENDATVVTGDRDFQRFPGLKLKLLF